MKAAIFCQRRRVFRALFGIAAGACVVAPPFSASAQDSLAPVTPRTQKSAVPGETKPPMFKTVGVWTAGAQNSGLRTRYGMQRERSLFMSGIRWTKRFSETSKGNWIYTTDVLPIVVSTHTPFYRDTAVIRNIPVRAHDGSTGYVTQEFDSLIQFNRTVYGAGWIPLGIGYESPRIGPANLQLGLSAGAIFFDRRMPDPEETRMNFTLDGTALIQLAVSKTHHFVVGYRFNHISNAHTGRVNPGMNTSMLNIGWAVQRGAKQGSSTTSTR